MEIGDLGIRLRARRTAAGETISAVAIRAGLSVPYIANLENGRGNPTLTALTALAGALGADLVVDLADKGDQADETGRAGKPAGSRPPVPASLTRFARTPRFSAEADRLAEHSGRPAAVQRELLLSAMSGVAAAGTDSDELTELDWHRILDAVVLISRDLRTGT
ncbi:MAG TPA: helix-turn-helix transcriptional regulator [Streptosporangiaceae bacterium]|nr:helix-turn-helix transcriptional regulator [Streptosporangiaceae bacterium]